jgi:K+-transporting ATPase ATPase C chain
MNCREPLKTAAKLLGAMVLLTGIAYPLAVLAVAELAFPDQAHGSLVRGPDGTVTGSAVIGQDFSAPRSFQGRPSATAGNPYNSSASGGSNLGPTNPALREQVAARVQFWRDLGVQGPIPSDLVTASASGLDPDITLEAALLQVPVIAKARNLSEGNLRDLVLSRAEDTFPFSPPRVNVLTLNMALDRLPPEEA